MHVTRMIYDLCIIQMVISYVYNIVTRVRM